MNRQILQMPLIIACLSTAAVCSERFTPPEGVERPSPMLQRLIQGMGTGNVFGAMDDKRPLIGVYFISGGDAGRDAERMARWKGAVDFVQVPPDPLEVSICERAGVPWQGISQMAVDVGKNNPAWLDNTFKKKIEELAENYRNFPNLAGWNSTSEPHLNPGSQTDDQGYDQLGFTEPTRKEFLEWLQAEYGDELPGVDTNGDGFTLNRECVLNLVKWEDLTPEMVKGNTLLLDAVHDWRETLVYNYAKEICRLFKAADPSRPMATRLTGPSIPPDWGLNLNYYDIGDAVGVIMYPELTWENRPESRIGEGLNLQLTADTIRVKLPQRPATAFIEWEATLPIGAHLKFGVKAPEKGDGVDFLVKVVDGFKPTIVFQQHLVPKPNAVPAKVDLDLSSFGGRKVKIRLENSPGAARDTKEDVALWIDPLLESGSQQASLIESANWLQARAGFRPSLPGDLSHDIITGPTQSTFDAAGCEVKMSVMNNRARLAGKRLILNETHPTSNSGTVLPEVFGSFWSRMLPFKPVGTVMFAAAMPGGAHSDISVEPMVNDIARWRGFLQLTKPYEKIARKRPVALFCPRAGGGLIEKACGLEKYGLDVYTVNSIEQARDYKFVILPLEYLDRESEAKVVDFLKTGAKGKKVIVLARKVRGPLGRKASANARESLREYLPVYAVSDRTCKVELEILPGVETSLIVPEATFWNSLPGYEPVKTADGRIVAARNTSMLVICGWPDDAGTRGTAQLDRIVEGWFGIEPYAVLDSGFVKVVKKFAVANSEGLWSIDAQGTVELGDSIAGYDISQRKHTSGNVNGPRCLYTFPTRGARIVDPGVCYPLEVKHEAGDVVATFDCPASLSDGDNYHVVFWTVKKPPSLAGDGWIVTDLGEGFYRASRSAAGVCMLRIPGAAASVGPKEWTPADH